MAGESGRQKPAGLCGPPDARRLCRVGRARLVRLDPVGRFPTLAKWGPVASEQPVAAPASRSPERPRTMSMPSSSPAPTSPPTVRAPGPDVPPKMDVFAAVLSYLIPGFGQIYQGRVGKGLLFCI